VNGSFVVDGAALKTAVKYAARQIAGRPVTPIHACLRCTVNGEVLAVAGLNENTTAVAEAVVDNHAGVSGSFVVAGRLLSALVDTFPAGPVRVEQGGGPAVAMTAGRTAVTLPLMPVRDFPELAVPAAPIGSVDAVVFADAVKRVGVAAERDTDKPPALRSVHLRFDPGGSLTVSATDRYQAGRQVVDWSPGPQAGGSCLVFAAGLLDAVAEMSGTLEVGLSGGRFSMRDDRRTLVSRTVDMSTFPAPQLDQGFAADLSATAIVSAAALGEPLRTLRSFHDDKNTMKLRVEFAPGEMRVSVAGQSGGGASVVDVDYNGPAAVMFVNAGRLQGAVGVAADDKVRLLFEPGSYKPIMVMLPGVESWRHLVMPIRDLGGS
jgi:DNA polymerase III sliding clamp (beta) subunit (PCNA family)